VGWSKPINQVDAALALGDPRALRWGCVGVFASNHGDGLVVFFRSAVSAAPAGQFGADTNFFGRGVSI
jgi:hypothetical protein